MFGDDFMLNTKLHYCMIVCALSLTRMAVLFQLLGMAPLSSTDHYGFKEEIEPILANAAETSMCAAHVRNVKRQVTPTM